MKPTFTATPARLRRALLGLAWLMAFATVVAGPLKQGTTRADGAEVHYVTSGEGAPVVLIHGWGGAAESWNAQLQAPPAGFRFVALDLPGHGKSPRPTSPVTMASFARAVDAVLLSEHIERAVLVGFSMGTPVMSRYYADHPGKVAAMVAVDGLLRGFRLTEEQKSGFLERYNGPEYKDAVRDFISRMFPNAGTEAKRDAVLATALHTPRETLKESFQAMFDSAAWEATRLDVPLLTIHAPGMVGSEEYQNHVRTLQPKAQFTLVPETGHFLMIEKPADFSRTLVAFLESPAVRTSVAAAPSGKGGLPGAGLKEGWHWLFDGKSLEAWRGYRLPGLPEKGWKVENGLLCKIEGEKGGELITRQKFRDFEFEWEWKIRPGGNNGVKYFVTEERPSAPGHEYQMIDDATNEDALKGGKRMTAAFYDVLPAASDKPLRPAGEWNASRLVVKGNQVEHWLNGRLVLAYTLGSETVKAGLAASKFKASPAFGDKIDGHIMLTDHNDACWFRAMRIREITPQ